MTTTFSLALQKGKCNKSIIYGTFRVERSDDRKSVCVRRLGQLQANPCLLFLPREHMLIIISKY